MSTVEVHDYGVPIKRAAEISGWEGGSFPTLLFRGVFGPAPAEPASSASLLHVAAAIALKQAEKAGISREQISPVLTQLADAVYSYLVMLELSEQRWHSVTCGTNLLQKLRSENGHSELQQMFAVRSGNTRQFALFPPSGPILSDTLPDSTGGSQVPYLDIRRIAHLIRVHVPGVLFF